MQNTHKRSWQRHNKWKGTETNRGCNKYNKYKQKHMNKNIQINTNNKYNKYKKKNNNIINKTEEMLGNLMKGHTQIFTEDWAVAALLLSVIFNT